jgi:hypothetical protein
MAVFGSHLLAIKLGQGWRARRAIIAMNEKAG